MPKPIRRAGPAALVLAAALASAATPPASRAEEGRVHTVQSEADLKKRADHIMKSITEGAPGTKATYGAVEKGTVNGVVIKNIEITTSDAKKVTIEQIEVRDFDWNNPDESKVADFSVRKLSIPVAELNEEPIELGLTSLTINAEIKGTFDEEKKTVDLALMTIDIVELMELTIRLTMVGISAADTKAMREQKGQGEKKEEEAAMKLFAKLSLASGSIAIKDKSLVARIIRMGAKKDKISEQEAKAKMLEMLAEQRKASDDDATREFIDAVVKFVTNPGTIELVAKPAQPVNLMAAFASVMASPTAVKQMLGLSITVK